MAPKTPLSWGLSDAFWGHGSASHHCLMPAFLLGNENAAALFLLKLFLELVATDDVQHLRRLA